MQIFGIGYFVAIEPFHQKGNTVNEVLFLILEIIFIIDFFVRCVKVPKDMENPTLKKTMTRYLKRKFIVDLVATFISDILLFVPGGRQWGYRLKLLRLIRFGEVKAAYIFVIKNYVSAPTKIKEIYTKLCDIILFTFLLTHLLTCAWIRLGALDHELPEQER